MKIYTYYDNLDFSHQNELLRLWIHSWQTQGFDPVVLSRTDAEKHAYYEAFVANLYLIHRNITNQELTSYGLSCYLRWLAYANLDQTDNFLMSDYDVINKNFIVDDIKINSPGFLDRYCPCLVYGNSNFCLEFCKDIINYSNEYQKNIIQEYKKQNCVWYHDQDFLAINHNRLKYSFYMNYVDLYCYGKDQIKTKLFHVAHRSVGEAKEAFPEFKDIDNEQLRINFIKTIIESKI